MRTLAERSELWPFVKNINTDPLPLRNQRGGFMNGWTSQTDRAFYQMQYLTGQDTDEVKMVIGNSHSSGILFPRGNAVD